MRPANHQPLRYGQAVVTVEIFLGVLLGLLAGMFLCARYLRQEIAANIGPRLARIELQLETLQSEVSLEAATRLATLRERLEGSHLPG